MLESWLGTVVIRGFILYGLLYMPKNVTTHFDLRIRDLRWPSVFL